MQGVSVACPTSHLEPGVVQAWSAPVTGLLDIGVYPSGINQVSEAVAADFRAATFSSFPVRDIARWKHRKLLTNLGNAIEAVCGPQERQGHWGTCFWPRVRRSCPLRGVLQRLARELANSLEAPGATPAATILERLESAREPVRGVGDTG